MRFYLFMALVFVALGLDLLLLSLGLQQPQARLFQPPAVQAAPRVPLAPVATVVTLPTATASPTTTPTVTPSPTASPTATPSPTASATATPSPTATPLPPQLLAAKAVSFTPSDRAVRANIRLALTLSRGALSHVLVAPGAVFSFNAPLGPRPQRLPWKYVVVRPTAVPGDPAAPTPELQRIQGGGLCDLASRFVMAARPLLPAKSFRFVNHVRSNGVRLRGVPTRDTVSIWAVGGGPGEQDLTITNSTDRWLEFTVDRAGERITVTARLWDRPPGGSSP